VKHIGNFVAVLAALFGVLAIAARLPHFPVLVWRADRRPTPDNESPGEEINTEALPRGSGAFVFLWVTALLLQLGYGWILGRWS
jgi:hypothetical protein